MKLLKKSTLSTEIALQTKQQIDAGLSIARKVDALRDKLASLVEQEATFVSGMQDRLKTALAPLHNKADQLKADIARLEEVRAKLQEPLNYAWEKLNNEKREVSTLKAKVAVGLQRITDKEADIDSIKKSEKAKLANIKSRERQLEESYASAIEGDKTIKETLALIENDKAAADKNIAVKLQEISNVEASVKVKERELDMELASVKKEREEILTTKAQLADQRATLERALARIKHD